MNFKNVEPKQYWKLINSDHKQKQCPIEMEKLFDHYKLINNTYYPEIIAINNASAKEPNNYLNAHFSEEAISHCIES